MRVQLHLISAPWATAMWPSGALGVLKAYIDDVFKDQIKTFSYSAHFEILFNAEDGLWPSLYDRVRCLREYSYLILFYQKFLSQSHGRLNSKEINNVLKTILKHETITKGAVSEEDLLRLESSTVSYIENKIVPNLVDDGINVVGFSLNFDQIYASLYIEKYLEIKHKDKKFLFLYGGYSAAYAEGIDVLQKLSASGFSVLGEGEKKLESIIRQLLKLNNYDSKTVLSVSGVIKTSEIPKFYKIPEAVFKTQIANVDDLPLPNYDEFYEVYEQAKKKDPFLKTCTRQPILLLEGSRGCFAKCDFCGLNSQWSGFRKLTAHKVYEKTIQLIEKYKINHIQYLDTVCDTWAEGYADLILQNSDKINFFMEIRTHHLEKYWTKLALAGAKELQLGVETFSQSLLTKMNKGTKVFQNVLALKYISELEVKHASNIMSRHPKSTLSDVKITKKILSATSHMGDLMFPDFYFKTNGPIFDLLTVEEQKNLKIIPRYPIKGKLSKLPGGTLNILPKRLDISIEVKKAWDSLRLWYIRKIRRSKNGKKTMTVTRQQNGILSIIDTRGAKKRTLKLKGDEAVIFDLCHSGPTVERIIQKLQWPEKRVNKNIKSLCRKKILLNVDGYFISLALRPRSELIANLNRAVEIEKK